MYTVTVTELVEDRGETMVMVGLDERGGRVVFALPRRSAIEMAAALGAGIPVKADVSCDMVVTREAAD